MLRIIATIAATLAIAIAFGATMFDRTSPSDDARDYGRFAGFVLGRDWYEDHESGIFGTTVATARPRPTRRELDPLVDCVPGPRLMTNSSP